MATVHDSTRTTDIVRCSRPAADTATASSIRHDTMSSAEFYLHGRLHNHAWLHLLDPERPLARLAVTADEGGFA